MRDQGTDATEPTSPVGASGQYDSASDPDGLTREDFPTQNDSILELLLAVVPGEADTDASVGVTLVVHGVLVSGNAVSFARWSKLWVTSVTEANQDVGSAFDRVLQNLVTERNDFRARRKVNGLPVPDSRHINLSDAVIVTGGDRQRVGLARVRRDRVDAWWL